MPGRERRFDLRSSGKRSGRRWSFSGRIPLETEMSWFILANLLDFVVTYRMIGYGGPSGVRFGESNPIALYFMNHWGLKGLLGLKLAVVLFVCAVAQLAYRRRPDLARFLLILGTIVVTAIVLYSVRMFFQAG
jgi:hypothetical protein